MGAPTRLEMTLTTAQLEELRAELFADDLPIEPRMLAWSEAQARFYFENTVEPPVDQPPAAELPSAATPLTQSAAPSPPPVVPPFPPPPPDPVFATASSPFILPGGESTPPRPPPPGIGD